MSGGFDYREYAKFAEKFGRTVGEFEAFLKRFIAGQAHAVISLAKLRTPVDTGLLRGRWRVESVRVKGGVVEAVVYNPLYYASFVELGHRQNVGQYVPALGVCLVQPWVEGRFMLTISLGDVGRAMPKGFDREFAAFVKKGGLG